MDNERIEFYQNRSLGERLSAAADFLRQNWKVFYKNILIPAIPFILLMAYFSSQVTETYSDIFSAIMRGDMSVLENYNSSPITSLVSLISGLFSLYLFAMSGAILSLYEEGNLTEKTSWRDLSSKMFSNAGKIFLVNLALGLIMIVVVLVFVLLIVMSFGGVLAGILSFILVVGLLAALVPMMLTIYPALFRGASTWGSIREGFRIGFKNWGSTFVILLIVGIMGLIIYFILNIPSGIVMLTSLGKVGVVSYIFSIISTLGTVLVYPCLFVFLAFQYFAITEKEEGISLQNKIDEFDNL